MHFHLHHRRRVDAIRNIEKLEDVHLEMNPIDTANSDTVLTFATSLEGRLDCESLVDRISDVILSNPNFIRFRSKYDLNTNSWTPIGGWTARQNAICHQDHEDRTVAESQSMRMVQTMDQGYAWVCHLQYQPDTNETIMRWILNHGLGDVYAIRLVVLSILDDFQSIPPPPHKGSPTKFHRALNDKKLSKYLRPLQTIRSRKHKRVAHEHSVDPIEFPALSLAKLERLAHKNQVTLQDMLICLVVETKQRVGEQDDDWIWAAFNPRDRHQFDRMDNLATKLPIYLGPDGDLQTIHNSTTMIEGSSLLHKDHPSGALDDIASPLYQDHIHSVTGLLGGQDEHPTIFYQPIRSMRFHLHRPNEFFFLEQGSSITTTFTVESSQWASRGALVHQTFLQIAEELHLLSD